MNAENPSMAKFKVVTETNLPNMCIACRLSADGRMEFVDLGLSLDTEDPLFIGVPDSALGTLYLCMNCVREIGLASGFLTPELTQSASDQLTKLAHKVEEAEKENDRLRALNESYVNVLTSVGAIADPSESDAPVEGQRESIFTRAEQGSFK